MYIYIYIYIHTHVLGETSAAPATPAALVLQDHVKLLRGHIMMITITMTLTRVEVLIITIIIVEDLR